MPNPALRNKANFEMACRLARELNKYELDKLIRRDPFFLITLDKSVVLQMAFEENHSAVELLLEHYKLMLTSDAAEGYARANNVEKVEEFLERGASIHYAVRGYAYSGNVERVDDLLKRGASMHKAIKSYASNGFIKETYDLLSHGGNIGDAIYGFAYAGLLAEVDKLLQLDNDPNHFYRAQLIFDAEQGFKAGGFFDDFERILKVLVHISNDDNRRSISVGACIYPRGLNHKDLFAKATNIRKIMLSYQLNYDQARQLHKKGMRETLLVIDNIGCISHDETIEVTSKLTGLNHFQSKGLFQKVCQDTHDGALQRIIDKHNSTLFAKRYGIDGQVRPARHKREREELEVRYKSNKRRIGVK